MLLKEIIKKFDNDFKIISDNSNNEINDIVLNSRNTNKKNIFVAIKGFKTDGHLFIEGSYKNGCRDFIIEDKSEINKAILNDSTIVLVKNARVALAQISNYIFDYPSEKLKLIGITGTKGKTTVTTLIHHIINSEKNASMFSTVRNFIAGESFDAERTTMESNELNKFLKISIEKDDQYAVVEVSSHAVTLQRVFGMQFDIGIFTSFSQDHLDLYGTMDKYFDAKLDFFRMLNDSTEKNKLAIINMDDPKGEEVCDVISGDVKIIRVGSKNNCDYYIKESKLEDCGMKIIIINNQKEYEFNTLMKGKFNITNISLAIAAAMELGFKYENIKTHLEKFSGVDGRFEIIQNDPFTIIVDYAHSPDSLQKILIEAKELAKGKIILVFGCTGDRDREKRSIMGKIAADYTNFSIITNDDTYSEDPLTIVKEVEKGFLLSSKIIQNDYLIILDRKAAIKEAIKKSERGDVLVIAGMGHEKVQILNDGPVVYNDKATVLELIKNL